MMFHWELLARVLIGTALGALIGWERDIHGRPAGLRTHLIVALASSINALGDNGAFVTPAEYEKQIDEGRSP